MRFDERAAHGLAGAAASHGALEFPDRVTEVGFVWALEGQGRSIVAVNHGRSLARRHAPTQPGGRAAATACTPGGDTGVRPRARPDAAIRVCLRATLDRSLPAPARR